MVKPERLLLETAQTLVDAGQKCGIPLEILHQGTSAIHSCAGVVIISSGLGIPGLDHQLRQRQPGGPRVLLWQLEPLPPAGLSAAQLEAGSRLIRWDISRLPRIPRKIIGAVVPASTRLQRGLRQKLARPLLNPPHPLALPLIAQHPVSAETLAGCFKEAAWIEHMHHGGALDAIAVSTTARQAFLTQRGLPCFLAPVGYHPTWGADENISRDIDVLFFGRIDAVRRQPVLAQVAERLQAGGRKLEVVTGGCWGQERQHLLSRTKIVLNPIKLPWDFPGMRMLMALGCGALVVADDITQATPYHPGVHFAPVTQGNWTQVIEHYLQDEAARQALVSAGKHLIHAELTASNILETLLAHLGYFTRFDGR